MIDQNVRTITSCRLCGAEGLQSYVDFGRVALGNNLQATQEAALAAESYPLELNRCGACGHFQLGHAVAPELLYATNYTYLSGIGPSFVKHFGDYAAWAAERTGVGTGSLVVDIGSNDGTCLAAFQALGATVCGVDPASLAARIANDRGVETLNCFFDADAVAKIIQRYGQADYITSHNVLAHVDDLAAVFANIYTLLKDDGYFAFEIGYFKEVLRTGCFDTTYHEHLDYHHATPLARHLTGIGFDLVELSVNDIQGGSLRLLLRKTGKGKILPAAAQFLSEERDSVLYNAEFLAQWKTRIELQMARFRKILRSHADRGAKIIAYGAPTKAVLLMKMAGLGRDDVVFVVEDNVHKVGRFLPGTGVEIKSSLALQGINPDVVVIFAWNFADDIMGKIHGKFDRPVEIVVPLPELRTISL